MGEAGQADVGLAGLNNSVGLEGVETVSSCLVLVPGVTSGLECKS